MSKSPGTSGTMPITGAACGIKPSKEAMEVDFAVDFSKAKDLLEQSQYNEGCEPPSIPTPSDSPTN